MAGGKRKVYDAKLKELVARRVQVHEMTVKEASDKYDVQPFQVLAWIGEYTLRKGEVPAASTPAAAPSSPAPDVHTGDTGLFKALTDEAASSTIDPSLARVIGEWWLKNRLTKELAKPDGNSGSQD
jgi:transposase-like protein